LRTHVGVDLIVQVGANHRETSGTLKDGGDRKAGRFGFVGRT
jgi:hypothetical protein